MGFHNNIADLVNNIKVGSLARLSFIYVRKSLLNLNILRIFYTKGIIYHFEIVELKIKVWLKYLNNHPIIKNISIVSKPSRRFFLSSRNLSLKRLDKGFSGFYVVSTVYGVLASTDLIYFYEPKISGELLIKINL